MKDADFLKRCWKQSHGISLVRPSNNLVQAYVRKSRNAVKSMELNFKEGITEWGISASYYARYFAVYALLQRLGIKSEIHDCTIALFKDLFRNMVPKDLISEFERAKADRVEAQYYTEQLVVNTEKIIEDTKNFVLEIERISDGLNQQKVGALIDKARQDRK